MPYEYELIFTILAEGPMAAADFAGWGRWRNERPQGMSNRLRGLVKRGWLYMPDPASGIYDVTNRAREAVCW